MTVASVEHCGAGRGISNAEKTLLICGFDKQLFVFCLRGFVGG